MRLHLARGAVRIKQGRLCFLPFLPAPSRHNIPTRSVATCSLHQISGSLLCLYTKLNKHSDRGRIGFRFVRGKQAKGRRSDRRPSGTEPKLQPELSEESLAQHKAFDFTSWAARMLQKRWKGCIFFSLAFLLCNASGVVLMASENSPSEFAKIVQSKQTRQARVCGADAALLSSLAGSDAEVMVTIPNEQLEHVAEFQEEAVLWVAAHVVPFLPTTRITHVLAGDDVLTSSSPGSSSAYFLVPAMLNLRSALAAAGLAGRVKVSSAVSGEALADPASSGVVAHVLRFLESSGSPLFLKSRASEASDAKVDAAYAAMRALGVSRVPVIAADLAAGGGVVPYYYYGYGYSYPGGQRRSLATGTFCVALQNADPAALQAGLNWACGPGHADCSAIQPGGACYQQNNLPALASYAYNDYYQKMASTGATCSFNGTATTSTNDPSSGSCVFAGSSTSGGSNSSTPVGASPPTSLSPPTGFTPPVGSSPPSSSEFSPPTGFTPPSGFTPPAGGGLGPGFGTPPGSFNGTGSFGPSGTLNPYNGVSRGLPRAGLTALSAAAVAVLLVSMDAM